MNEKQEFKPYIPADKVMPELTVTSVIIGILLAVLFGGANAYLGLRVGMTVSASIPAAVISMGIIRFILRRDSILENNMVQTIGSAGESVAAGAIFTLPALFMWAQEGGTSMPSLIEIALIALIGGFLGVLFMIPLRSALIVQEHGVLPYPEGQACAEVLVAGEEGGAGWRGKHPQTCRKNARRRFRPLHPDPAAPARGRQRPPNRKRRWQSIQNDPSFSSGNHRQGFLTDTV